MPVVDGFDFLGCFKDNSERDLAITAPRISGGYTHSTCNAYCASQEATVFALQHGDQCFCDNDYSTPSDTYHAVPEGNCQRAGFPTLSGGAWANAIFRVALP